MHGHDGTYPNSKHSTKFINMHCEECNKIRAALMESAVCVMPPVECTHTAKETPSEIAL